MSKITELQALRDSVEYLTDLIGLIRQGKASDGYIDMSLGDIAQLNKESDKSPMVQAEMVSLMGFMLNLLLDEALDFLQYSKHRDIAAVTELQLEGLKDFLSHALKKVGV